MGKSNSHHLRLLLHCRVVQVRLHSLDLCSLCEIIAPAKFLRAVLVLWRKTQQFNQKRNRFHSSFSYSFKRKILEIFETVRTNTHRVHSVVHIDDRTGNRARKWRYEERRSCTNVISNKGLSQWGVQF